mmetsp:Transcript_17214/g.47684  ORF Transcript_17214/g.47684 Transcript_17214/m.47684 type:complete len:217 (-) Transcript_17214:127-777(-)
MACTIRLWCRSIELGNGTDHGGLQLDGEVTAGAHVVVNEGGARVVNLDGRAGRWIFVALVHEPAGVHIDDGRGVMRAQDGELVPQVESFDVLRDRQVAAGDLRAFLEDATSFSHMAETRGNNERFVCVAGGAGIFQALVALRVPWMIELAEIGETWSSSRDCRKAFRQELADARAELHDGVVVRRDAESLAITASAQNDLAHGVETGSVGRPVSIL